MTRQRAGPVGSMKNSQLAVIQRFFAGARSRVAGGSRVPAPPPCMPGTGAM
jgi:hypothetical protein